MNLDSAQPATPMNPFRPSRTKRIITIVAIIATLLVVGGAAGALFAHYLASMDIIVPASIKQKVKSPIYVPTNLPGAYRIVEESYSFDEGTVIFYAADEVDSKLVFTEQQKPSDLNFEQFYEQEVREAKTLSNVPFASVWGKAKDNRLILSVITEDTWIIMTTDAPLGESDMVRIAGSLKQQ